MVERQLTSTGMQQIGEALEATGLMGQDGAYHPILNPGKEGLSAFGPESLHFDSPVGRHAGPRRHQRARPVRGRQPALRRGVDDPGRGYVLAELATKLGQLDAWLPPEAWEVPRTRSCPGESTC